MSQRVVILGAGPAGLMAAWELVEAGYKVTILDRDEKVGGMCATQCFQGKNGDYRFDYGGHRFITRNPKLLAFVDQLMAEDLLYAQRKSVIRYRGRIYAYPLAIGSLIKNAPSSLLFGAMFDLIRLLFKPRPKDRAQTSFAHWIESRFGRTLYKHFFEGYTAKLWGIDPRKLSGDWAAQRISLVDLKDIVRRLLPKRSGKRGSLSPRTYAQQYRYPKKGFGQLFTRLAEALTDKGVEIKLASEVNGLAFDDVDHPDRITSVSYRSHDTSQQLSCDHVIATIPLSLMCQLTGFDSGLRYRSLRFMNLPMQTQNISDNTWQYLSDPHILGTRLQEPKRRSPYMAPEGQTSVMIEIPCNKGDEIWTMSGDQLRNRVLEDLASLDVDPALNKGEFFTTFTEHAYPLMDLEYREKRARAIQHLMQYPNLIMSGRQGTFRYIFTDTAMEMGMMAASSIIEGVDRREAIFDFRNEQAVIETQSVA